LAIKNDLKNVVKKIPIKEITIKAAEIYS